MIVAIEGGRRNPGVIRVIDLATALGVSPASLLAEAAVDEDSQ